MVGGRWAIGVLCGALALPTGAAAQEPGYVFRPELYGGLGLGAQILGNNSDFDVCPADPAAAAHCQTITRLVGVGAALFAGLRAHENVGVELSYDAFFHQGSDDDPYNLATLQSLRGDVRIFFWPGDFLDPYLSAGAGVYLIGDEYAAAVAGGGFQLGAGLDLFLDPLLSLGLNVQYRGIYFGTYAIDRRDLPGWSADGEVQEGFLHSVVATLNLTVHLAY